MGWAILGWDGSDADAGPRRAAVRDPHLAVIRAWAAEGRLALGVPLFDADGRIGGSLMVLAGAAEAERDAYLAAEPFVTDGVWVRREVHPFRIAPLPYHPLVAADAPVPFARTHTVLVAWDGTDEGAGERRQAARDAHLARVAPMAASGVLCLGGALLDAPGGRMRGSIALTRHATDTEARAWWADDPYVTGGVFQEMTFRGTRVAPLPYRPLPGAA